MNTHPIRDHPSANGGDGGNSSQHVSGDAWRRNYSWLGILFAVNHGCVTTPVALATSVLDPDTGYAGNSMLYLMSVVSTLVFAVPAVAFMGLKGSLIASFLLYASYSGLFALALGMGHSHTRFVLFVTASILGGAAAGVLWTAQGTFFGRTAALIARLEGSPREVISRQLAGVFAFQVLFVEAAAKLGFSLLQRYDVSTWTIGALYTFFGVLSAGLLLWLKELPYDEPEGAPVASLFSKTSATIRLWRDPKLWLLSPTNVTFAFSAAYMNGYFSAMLAKPELGEKAIGACASITVIVGAVASPVLAAAGAYLDKGTILMVGALAFFCIQMLAYLGCCGGWGWWLVAAYVLQGVGRAVYESTNKAVFADFFKGVALEPAFANCMLQNSLASALCFTLSGSGFQRALGPSIMAFAFLVPISYSGASALYMSADGAEVSLRSSP